MNAGEKNKRVQNLFRSLQNDSKSVFYTIDRLTKSLIKKAKTSFYDKDKVFVNLYGQIEDKDFFKKENETLPLVTPFVDKKTNIDHSTLYSFHKPILHVNIADIRFLAKSAVDPKYCLLLVYLFTSKIYVYPIKNRSLLAKKLGLFYNDIQPKKPGTMHLQTDLEFNQNKMKQLNQKFDDEVFHTQLRGGKAFAAEKNREFKKILLRSKRFQKMKKNRIRLNQLIKNAAENMNETVSTKYGLAPENIEKRSLNPKDGKYFQEIYDFVTLRKIQNNQMRNDKYN